MKISMTRRKTIGCLMLAAILLAGRPAQARVDLGGLNDSHSAAKSQSGVGFDTMDLQSADGAVAAGPYKKRHPVLGALESMTERNEHTGLAKRASNSILSPVLVPAAGVLAMGPRLGAGLATEPWVNFNPRSSSILLTPVRAFFSVLAFATGMLIGAVAGVCRGLYGLVFNGIDYEKNGHLVPDWVWP